MSDPREPYDGTPEQQEQWQRDLSRAQRRVRSEHDNTLQNAIDSGAASASREGSSGGGLSCASVFVAGIATVGALGALTMRIVGGSRGLF